MGPTRPTVSQARTWHVTPLLRQATEWEDAHDHLSQHVRTAAQAVDESGDFWRGSAADAMRARHTRAATAATTVRSGFTDGAAAARRGYQLIGGATTTALQAINNAELDGYHLADDGTATVTPIQTATALALGSGKAVTALAVLDHGARTHTTAVQSALAGLGTADTETTTAISAAFSPLEATEVAGPMQTGWMSWIVDAVVIVATIPLDDIGVGEGIDAAVITAMRQAGKDAAEQAAKNGATKDEAVQAGKDAMRQYAKDHGLPGPEWAPPKEAADKVPKDWGSPKPNSKGTGERWLDPKNPNGNGVRIDKGDPKSPQPSQRVDHVIVRSGGKVIGPDGNPIPPGASIQDNPQTHIPLQQWLKWQSWDHP